MGGAVELNFDDEVDVGGAAFQQIRIGFPDGGFAFEGAGECDLGNGFVCVVVREGAGGEAGVRFFGEAADLDEVGFGGKGGGDVLQRDVVELLDEDGQMHADAARAGIVDDEQIEEVGLGLISLGEDAKVRRPGERIGSLHGEVGGAAGVDQIDWAGDGQHDRICREACWRCSRRGEGGGHAQEF